MRKNTAANLLGMICAGVFYLIALGCIIAVASFLVGGCVRILT